jgi:hypothetical protein
MKTWGSGGIAPPLLTSALDEGEWSDSRPSRVTAPEKAPGTLGREAEWALRAGLQAITSFPRKETNPGRPPGSPSPYIH